MDLSDIGNVPAVAGLLYGIKPAIVAIVLFAAYGIGCRTLKNKVPGLVSGTAFVAVAVFHVPFPAIILAAGPIGYFGSRLAPPHFEKEEAHRSANDENVGHYWMTQARYRLTPCSAGQGYGEWPQHDCLSGSLQ